MGQSFGIMIGMIIGIALIARILTELVGRERRPRGTRRARRTKEEAGESRGGGVAGEVPALLTFPDLDDVPRLAEDPAGSGPPFERCESLLTKGEIPFYRVLREAVGTRWVVFGKVRLADVIRPMGSQFQSGWQAQWNRVVSKHIDFVLCDPVSLAPRLILELDDKSHGRRERQERDEFVDTICAEAGMPILHVTARSGYRADQLREEIRAQLPGVVWDDAGTRDPMAGTRVPMAGTPQPMVSKVSERQEPPRAAEEPARAARAAEEAEPTTEKESAGETGYEKLTTSRLAKELGLSTQAVRDRLVALGWLERSGDGEERLTETGRRHGGELRCSRQHGPYFLWPRDLKL